jgi:hypothetical protein
MGNWFRHLFKADPPDSARDKFVARLLGIFSEEIVRVWCQSPRSPYEDLGRPRVVPPGQEKGHTLDFTLQSRANGRCYVAEMKCWVEYQGYRHLTLQDADQLEELEGPAFRAFLAAASRPARCRVTIAQRSQTVHGAILIWGDVSSAGRAAVQERYGLAAVHSLKEIVSDLIRWKDARYEALLKKRSAWCSELFQGLAAPKVL